MNNHKVCKLFFSFFLVIILFEAAYALTGTKTYITIYTWCWPNSGVTEYLFGSNSIVNPSGINCDNIVSNFQNTSLQAMLDLGCRVEVAGCETYASHPDTLYYGICCPLTGDTSETSVPAQSRPSYIVVKPVAPAIISSVVMGGEDIAARSLCNSLLTSVGYDDPQPGFARTGSATGYEYSGSSDVSNNTSTLNVNCWKRGLYSPSGGGAVPFPDVLSTGSAAGGSISTTDIGAGMFSALSAAHAAGWLGSAGGPVSVSGDGITSALNSAGSGGTFVPPTGPAASAWLLSSGVANELKNNFVNTSSAAINSFIASAKNTGLGQLINGFFGGAPSGGGSPPVISIDGGQTFGSHSFDFNVITPHLLIIKSIILILFGYISVKVIFLKGG